MKKITLYYIYDPMCSWCYAFDKTFDEIKNKLSKKIEILYIPGGLAAHDDNEMPKEMQISIQNIWYEIEKQTKTKFNHDFWKNNIPKRSTYLSCQATIAARLQDKEEEMIKSIQKAYYLDALNPSNEDTLIHAAQEINLDIKKFKKDLYSQETLQIFKDDLNLRAKLRVNSFPSLVLKYKKEIYPIQIQFNESIKMLENIENLAFNQYY